MQVDAGRFLGLANNITSVLFLPLQLTYGIYLMFNLVGVSSFAGLGVISIMMGLNFVLG